MGEYQHLEHTFEPVYDKNSRVLILGSFPSVKSRENNFYYGHPQNRFWKVMAAILGCPLPISIKEKKAILQKYGLAVWDVIGACDIVGSDDSSIKNVRVNDLQAIWDESKIERVYGNGKKASRLYEKYGMDGLGSGIITLPSTSPANAAYSLDSLIKEWSCIL